MSRGLTGTAIGLQSRLQSMYQASDRARWIMIFVPVAALMLATTNYGPIFFVDGAAAFHPAWHLVHHGHLYVDDLPLRAFAFVEGQDGHLFSNRTPGLIAMVVPAYLLWPFGDEPSGVPAAVTSCLLVAGSVATLALILEQVVSRRLAAYAALVAGFGTSLWSVAAAEYFPHAATTFWLLLAVLLLSRDRNLTAGLALMLAITIRPHLAVVAFVLGLWAGWHRRSAKVALSVGVPSVLGLLLVMSYNEWIFSRFNLQGGYADYVAQPLKGQLPSTVSADYLLNVAGSLLSGPRGLLLLTPVLLCLLPGVPRAWSASPWWAKASAVGGLWYMVVQWQIQNGENGFLGGYLFYSYRYSLELLMLAAPLLAVSYRVFVQDHPRRMQLTLLAALISVWIHAVGASMYDLTGSYPFHPWLAWSPAATLWGSSVAEISVALVALVALIAIPPLLVRDWQADSRLKSVLSDS